MSDRAEVRILPPFVLRPFSERKQSHGLSRRPPSFRATSRPGGRCRVDRAGGTAFDARKTTTALVDSGVFRFTRNPVYLSMVLLVIGVSLVLNSFWSLLLAVPTGSALCLTAIRPEERYLEAKFGATYRAYRSEVPRWFSIRRVLTAF